MFVDFVNSILENQAHRNESSSVEECMQMDVFIEALFLKAKHESHKNVYYYKNS